MRDGEGGGGGKGKEGPREEVEKGVKRKDDLVAGSPYYGQDCRS